MPFQSCDRKKATKQENDGNREAVSAEGTVSRNRREGDTRKVTPHSGYFLALSFISLGWLCSVHTATSAELVVPAAAIQALTNIQDPEWETSIANTVASIRQAEVKTRAKHFAKLRHLLLAHREAAQKEADITKELVILHRLARLPVTDGAPDATAEINDLIRSGLPSIGDLDRLYEETLGAIERDLLQQQHVVRDHLSEAMRLAEAGNHAARFSRAWDAVVQCQVPWSANLLPRPFVPAKEYDLVHAIPIPQLPAYIEVTVPASSYDLHLGVRGRDGEDTMEIYVGGHFGRVDGIRATPGGVEIAYAIHFPFFGNGNKKPITPTLWPDDNQSTLHAYLPTTIRFSLSSAGVIVSRMNPNGHDTVVRHDHLTNNPTAFLFRSPTLFITSVRTFPATNWADVSKQSYPPLSSVPNF